MQTISEFFKDKRIRLYVFYHTREVLEKGSSSSGKAYWFTDYTSWLVCKLQATLITNIKSITAKC